MTDVFFYYPRTIVNRNGVILLKSTSLTVSDTQVVFTLPKFRLYGQGTLLINLLQDIPEGTTETLPLVLSANGGTQAITKQGGEPLTVGDLTGVGVYEFYYDSEAGIVQLLSTVANVTTASSRTVKSSTK